MYRGLEALKQRADEGDPLACVELGDELLARAPYVSRRWESDAQWCNRKNELAYAEIRANDAYDCMGKYSDPCVTGVRGYLEWEQCVTRARIRLERHIEQLGQDTPGRRASLEAALHYHRRAAELGDPGGMVRLGWRHMLAQGTPLDERAAVDWWERAAECGDRLAADMLERWRGPTPADPE
jgi:TPR repeat protein